MAKKPNRKLWRVCRRILSITATFSIFLVLSPFVLLAVVHSQKDGKIISIPKLNSFIQHQVSKSAPNLELEIAAGGLSKGDRFLNPKIVFNDVIVRQKSGAPIITVPKVSADFSIISGLGSSKDNSNFLIEDARLFLLRDGQGRFNLINQNDDQDIAFSGTIDQVIDQFFELPIAKNIKTFGMNNISLSYIDGLTEKRFHLNQGNVQIRAVENELMISSAFELPRDDQAPSLIRFSGRRTRGNPSTDVTFKIDNADPLSLANQVPALDWLRNIEAEVSASFVVELNEDARPKQMSGVLDFGAGRLRATPSSSAAAFKQAKAYFEFDAVADVLEFSNFSMDTSLGVVSGSASSQLARDLAGHVIGATTDLKIDRLSLTQPKLFQDAITFENGRAKVEISFEPFHVNLVKGVLNHRDLSIVANGDLWAQEKYWQSKFDLRLDQISANQVKEFWPLTFIPKTRKWVSQNLQQGQVQDLHGFFNRQDGVAEFDFSFAFDDVKTGIVKTMEPVHGAQGEGSLNQDQLTLNLAQGYLTPLNGTQLDLSGSLFHIPNINTRPAIGQITLAAAGDLQSALKVLDIPKFRYIEKFGQTTDFASGQTSVLGWLEVPLTKDVKKGQIKFNMSGIATDVSSDKLVKGRKLRSKQIAFQVSDKGLNLSGNATLDSVPAKFNWSQAFVDNPTQVSQLNSSLTLNQQALDVFNVSLPDGSFSGSTPASFNVKLLPQKPAAFDLTSNLKGATLRIDSLGWRKGKNQKGSLKVVGKLTEPIQIDSIQVNASGLTAKGNITLQKDGQFREANFPTVKIDKWLSTSVTLTGVGNDATTRLQGGVMDLRKLDIGGSGGEKAGPLDIALDRLRITDDQSLTSFSASISRNGAPTGRFSARVNGGARIKGEIKRGKHGAQIIVSGQSAGAVLKSAGFFDNIEGGVMRMVLEPTAETDVYTGSFEAVNLRMNHSNSMAALLDSISLVGLLQKLEKGGIQFQKAKGWFDLRPEGVQLREVSLVGVSMGISLKGWYASNTKTVDFDGVVTPIYAVNGALERIGGKLFGRQKGEGLFSFVYTMKGPAAQPKVRVKPLSILTPGVFRQIFRQDIPAPPK